MATTITETLRLPSGVAPSQVEVYYGLAGAGGALIEGFDTINLTTIVAEDSYVEPNGGATTINLTRNDQITPSGTRWRRRIRYQSVDIATDFLSITADATKRVDQVLSDPPSAIPGGGLDAHLIDTIDAHDASAISFVPAGTIAATDVQAALVELDTEKIPLTQRAAANGVATLDAGSKIPDGQIPDGITRDSELTAAVNALLAGAPGALDTLNELATALGNDASFATTVTNALAGKVAKASNGSDFADLPTTLATLGGAVRNRAVNTQTVDYTLVLADAIQHVIANKTSAIAITVPPNSSVAFPVGTEIPVTQLGVGPLSIVAGGGVTINGVSGVLLSPAQYATMRLVKRATDTWLLTGQTAATVPATEAVKINRLAVTALNERIVKNAAHRVEYEDATQWNEAWAAVTAWNLNVAGGVQVSSNKVYAAANGNPQAANRAAVSPGVGLATGERLRAKASIVLPAVGTSGFVWFGVTNEAADAAPTAGGTKFFAIGFDVSTNNCIVWQGSAVGGSGATTLATGVAAGTFYVDVIVDESYISLVIAKSDHSLEYRAQLARSTFGAIGNIGLWNSDARDLTGAAIGVVGVKKSFASQNPRTIEGIADTVIWTMANGRKVRIVFPKIYDSRKPMTTQLYCGGHGEDAASPFTDSLKRAFIQTLVDNGNIVISVDPLDRYGNQAQLDDYLAAYQYARDRLALGPLFLLVQSLGGLTGANILARRAIPGIAGMIGIYPVYSLAAAYANPSGLAAGSTEIDTAYGTPYATATLGYDPVLQPGYMFRGVPSISFASPSDVTAVKTLNSDVFAALTAPYAPEATVVACTGGHGDPSHFQPTVVQSFIDRVAYA